MKPIAKVFASLFGAEAFDQETARRRSIQREWDRQRNSAITPAESEAVCATARIPLRLQDAMEKRSRGRRAMKSKRLSNLIVWIASPATSASTTSTSVLFMARSSAAAQGR